MWFSGGLGSAGLMVGLRDLKGLFQPQSIETGERNRRSDRSLTRTAPHRLANQTPSAAGTAGCPLLHVLGAPWCYGNTHRSTSGCCIPLEPQRRVVCRGVRPQSVQLQIWNSANGNTGKARPGNRDSSAGSPFLQARRHRHPKLGARTQPEERRDKMWGRGRRPQGQAFARRS